MSAIDKARKQALKDFIGMIVLTIIFFSVAWKLNQKNQWEFSSDIISVWFWAVGFFCVLGTYMSLHYYILNNRVNKMTLKDYILWFKYNNGDELIIGNRIIIPYSKNTKKKTEITGVSWGVNNIKGALNDLKEGSLPISLIIPSIHFASNKLPVFIPLFKISGDKIFIYFVDIEDHKLLLIIITNKNQKTENVLSYPITEEINFNLNDFNQLQIDLKQKHINFNAMHINEETLKN